MSGDAGRAVREIARWSLREVDGPGEESLYDGMETDASGDWVRAEDADHAIEALRRQAEEAYLDLEEAYLDLHEMFSDEGARGYERGKRDENEACGNVEPSIGSAPDGLSTLTWSIGYAAGIDAMRDAIRARIGKED